MRNNFKLYNGKWFHLFPALCSSDGILEVSLQEVKTERNLCVLPGAENSTSGTPHC
jgi:hypothetical protein